MEKTQPSTESRKKTKLVSLGDYGSQIESSTIWILSRPNSIVNYNPIPIPTTISCSRSQFQFINVIYF